MLGALAAYLAVGLVLVVGSLAVTRRNRRLRARPGDPGSLEGFEATGEVFIDPTTGVRQRVWFNPATGERRYQVIGRDGGS